MFFELRQYRTKPGQREKWVKFMEEEIIPFQVSKGMVILGSFVGQEEDDLYVWMPSRPGEFRPEPLTEPDVTLSRHPARATVEGCRLPSRPFGSSHCWLTRNQI